MDELEESGHDDRHMAASNGKQNFARYMIGGLCLILFLALPGVGIEGGHRGDATAVLGHARRA